MGVDANAAGLRELSGRAHRAGLRNLIYVRAAVEALPAELTGLADHVTVVLPWGSLLAAVTGGSTTALRNVRALSRPGGRLTVVLALDAARDQAELARLGLPALDEAYLDGPLADAYRAAGFQVRAVRHLPPEALMRWPSTWARRLAHSAARRVVEIEATAD